jgi:hypothetical protein
MGRVLAALRAQIETFLEKMTEGVEGAEGPEGAKGAEGPEVEGDLKEAGSLHVGA